VIGSDKIRGVLWLVQMSDGLRGLAKSFMGNWNNLGLLRWSKISICNLDVASAHFPSTYESRIPLINRLFFLVETLRISCEVLTNFVISYYLDNGLLPTSQ
jgi:hypothetical protein